MTHNGRAVVFACAVAVVAAMNSGCSLLAKGGKPLPVIDSLTGDTIQRFVDLQVDNHNWSDVTVYLLHGGARTRLGTAGTARSTEFRFPASYAFANRVSLLVAPVGSNSRFESERFRVEGGQRVLWTIENSLPRSSLLVR